MTSYRNGVTVGVRGGNPNPPKRGRVAGWSAGAVRRHTAWLYGVNAPALDGVGTAVTLTLRDIPTSAEWSRLRKSWVAALRLQPGFIRVHWVVEWQRRGAPHLHAACYFDRGGFETEIAPVVAWLRLSARYGSRLQSQHSTLIDGPLGWLQYLSKHAARGARHYQRQGHPPGWESTGRLWGYGGQWPTEEPLRYEMDMPAYHRYRRLVRSWRLADARSSGNSRRIALARRMLTCADPRLSAVRGVSDWVPESTAASFVALLASEGRDVRQIFDA